MKKLFLVSMILLLSACGSKLDGTYKNNDGLQLTFNSNGTVSTTMLDMEMELSYEVNGNKIKVQFPQGDQIWTLKEDGSIDAGFLGKYTKK